MRSAFVVLLQSLPLLVGAETVDSPLSVAWRLDPADDQAMIQCLQKAFDNNPALSVNQHKADWFLDLSLYRPAEGGQAWLAVSLSRIFDSKQELNAWMTGFDHPLPYAAMVDLGKITYGLVRPQKLWVEAMPLPIKDCSPLVDRVLEAALGRP